MKLLALLITTIISMVCGFESDGWYEILKAENTCCPGHTTEASCSEEGGTNCVWIANPNNQIAQAAGSQCVGHSYVQCKKKDITACCTPQCHPKEPAPAPAPGQPAPAPPSPPVCGPKVPGTLTPTTPLPTTPSPTTPSPTTPSPTTPSPTTPSPTTPSPTTPSPTTPSPTTPSPTTPSPTTPSPTTPSPTTPSPIIPSTTTAVAVTPSPTKYPVESGQNCELGVNYAFEGYPCQINGDPHFVVWSGNNHDYQGQPDKSINGLLRNQYYYITQCAASSVEDMPFRLLGSHYKMYPTVTGLDVLTFELFDTHFDSPQYYLHVHPEFVSYSAGTGFSSDYDANNPGHLTNIHAGTSTDIGGRFNVQYTRQSANTIKFTLTIDGQYTVIINLNGQNGDSTRYRMNYAVIQLDAAYKCHSCGLCGDFNHVWTQQEMEYISGCDGGDIGYRAGLSADTTPEAYDIYGWTFEKEYWHQTCSTNGYSSDNGDFVYIEPCDANIKAQVADECKLAVFRNANCCNGFPDICQDLQADCVFDACVLSTDSDGVGDPTLIQHAVFKSFDIAFDEFCDLAQNSDLFGDPANGGDTSHCKQGYEQCGGTGYDGETCCKSGYECVADSEWWSACKPLPAGSGPCQDNWAQCGGKTWTGKTCCNDGYACIRQDDFYAQCLEIPSEKAIAAKQTDWIYNYSNQDGFIQIICILAVVIILCGIKMYRKRDKDLGYVAIEENKAHNVNYNNSGYGTV